MFFQVSKYQNDQHGNEYVMLSLMFISVLVEQQVDSYVYDVINFLSAAGGNLGLFLGFSCLSIILYIIDMIESLRNIS